MNRILTYSGRHLDFRNPDPAEIAIGDIAVALSRACRFSGQCRLSYSVAQHSVLVSLIVPAEHALEALLHDATEAWLGDVSTPLKALLPEYVRIEKNLDRVVRRKFGLPEEMSGPVHRADRVLLATEKRDLMPEDTDEWPVLAGVSPLPGSILPWTENSAREIFLERWARLTGGGAVHADRETADRLTGKKGGKKGKARFPSGILALTVSLTLLGSVLAGPHSAFARGGFERGRYSCPPPADLSGVRSPADLRGEHYSPQENLEAIDVVLIDGAKNTLEIAMYAFTDRRIADAVIRAASRGVRVWIYRDGIQIRDRGDKMRRLMSSAPGQNGLIAIRVKRNSSRNIMHLKAYAIDGTWLRTGSANWSPPGEGAYCTRGYRNHWNQQDNNLFLTDRPREIRKFEGTFLRLWKRSGNRPWTESAGR